MLGSIASQVEAADQVSLIALRDNTLIESDTGATSNGAGNQVRCGRTGDSGGSLVLRTVLAFDLSGLPPGGVVRAATLRLTLTNSSSGALPVTLHRVLADWGEGASVAAGGKGAPSQPGDATWIHRSFPDQFWRSPGGDFDPASTASAEVGSLPISYAWSSPELTQLVQHWLDQPADNVGVMLRGEEAFGFTAKAFASREHPNASLRPTLIIELQRSTPCPADIAPVGSPNGTVNVDDLLAVINAWGPCADSNNCPADIVPPAGNDLVNVDDLLAVINGWGACP